jgi:hypothetical protein
MEAFDCIVIIHSNWPPYLLNSRHRLGCVTGKEESVRDGWPGPLGSVEHAWLAVDTLRIRFVRVPITCRLAHAAGEGYSNG